MDVKLFQWRNFEVTSEKFAAVRERWKQDGGSSNLEAM